MKELDLRTQTLVALGIGLVALIFLALALQGVLVALGLAGFLAYLFNPWVERLEGRGVSRTVSSLGLIALALGLLSTAVLGLVPYLQAQAADLIQQVPIFLDRVRTVWLPWLQARLPIEVPMTSQEALQELVQRASQFQMSGRLPGFVSGAFVSTAGFVMSLFQLVLVPVLAFYALRDAPQMRRGALNLFPEHMRAGTVEIATQVNDVISAYLRGQLTVMLILGSMYAVAFSLAGVPSGVVVGLIGGLLMIVPFVGPAITVSLALLLCLVQYGVDIHLLYVLGGFAVVQTLEGMLITPRVVGESLGLHPVAVILGLVAGGQLLGFLGIVLAVPLLAVVRVLIWPTLAGAEPTRTKLKAPAQAPAEIDTPSPN